MIARCLERTLDAPCAPLEPPSPRRIRPRLRPAQPTITAATPLMPNPGVPVSITVTGTAGQSFAVIGSTTWSGFSYAGVNLAVGTDVIIHGTGVLNGSGQGTVTFTPPFPARDRYYVQGVTSANGFATITPTSRLTLVNNQEARLSMPIGAMIRADGTTDVLVTAPAAARQLL